jgi:hypothetical protein
MKELDNLKRFFFAGFNFGLERDLLRLVSFSWLKKEPMEPLERAKLIGLKMVGYFL